MKKFTNLDDFGVSDKKSFFQTFEAPNVMELEEQLANFEKSNNCTEINRSAPAAACFDGISFIKIKSKAYIHYKNSCHIQ